MLNKILSFDLFESSLNVLSKEQIHFLDSITSGRWRIDENTGYVEILGNVNISSPKINSTRGIKFGTIHGIFSVSSTSIDSLEGWFPKEVYGNIHIYNNPFLKDLKGLPRKIDVSLDIFRNFGLTSLEGSPEFVGGSYELSQLNIISLDGLPLKIKRDLRIENLPKLKSIKGLNKIDIGESLIINNCSLTSLEGSPEIVNNKFLCNGNKLTTLEGGPKSVYSIACIDNPLTSFKGAPEKIINAFVYRITLSGPGTDNRIQDSVNYYRDISKGERSLNLFKIIEDIKTNPNKADYLIDIIGPNNISNLLKEPKNVIILKDIWHVIEGKDWYNEIKYPNQEIKEILSSLNLLGNFGL